MNTQQTKVNVLLLGSQERDNLDKAMECYSAALSVKPDFPQSLNNMGVIYTAQVRRQSALPMQTCGSNHYLT